MTQTLTPPAASRLRVMQSKPKLNAFASTFNGLFTNIRDRALVCSDVQSRQIIPIHREGWRRQAGRRPVRTGQ